MDTHKDSMDKSETDPRKETILKILIVLFVIALGVAHNIFFPDDFCVRTEDTQFTSYPYSDFFDDPRPAIYHNGVVYPFDDSLYEPQPYIRARDGIAHWADFCQVTDE